MTRTQTWKATTREERYYTALLFHDLRKGSGRLLRLMEGQLGLARGTKVKETGYEVCFFRDAYHNHLIERHRKLEKQTFDLVLFLNSNQMVIIEAKAQQGFTSKQIGTLVEAKSMIAASGYEPARQIMLVALTSSRYSPRAKTREAFDAWINWGEVAKAYSDSENYRDYLRADDIYGDRRIG